MGSKAQMRSLPWRLLLTSPASGEHFEMLGDGLPGDVELAAEARDGEGPTSAEADEQAQARGIPQRGEERRRVLQARGGEGLRP